MQCDVDRSLWHYTHDWTDDRRAAKRAALQRVLNGAGGAAHPRHTRPAAAAVVTSPPQPSSARVALSSASAPPVPPAQGSCLYTRGMFTTTRHAGTQEEPDSTDPNCTAAAAAVPFCSATIGAPARWVSIQRQACTQLRFCAVPCFLLLAHRILCPRLPRPQGLHDIASVLLLVCGEEPSYALLERLALHHLRDCTRWVLCALR